MRFNCEIVTTIAICMIGNTYNLYCNFLQGRQISDSQWQKYHRQSTCILDYFIIVSYISKQSLESIKRFIPTIFRGILFLPHHRNNEVPYGNLIQLVTTSYFIITFIDIHFSQNVHNQQHINRYQVNYIPGYIHITDCCNKHSDKYKVNYYGESLPSNSMDHYLARQLCFCICDLTN